MTKKAKPAAAGRAVATGVSMSALLGIVAGFTASESTALAPPTAVHTTRNDTPDVVRVVVRVHHTKGAPYVVPAPQPPVRTVYVHRPAPVTTTHASH